MASIAGKMMVVSRVYRFGAGLPDTGAMLRADAYGTRVAAGIRSDLTEGDY